LAHVIVAPTVTGASAVRPSRGYLRSWTPSRTEFRPLIAALLAAVAGVLPVFLTASLAGQINHSFAFSEVSLGLAVALFHVVGAVISPGMGRVLALTGVRGSLRLGAGVAALTCLAIARFAHSGTDLMCLLMIAGLSNGAAGPSASALLRATILRKRHGLAFGTQQAGAPAGLLLAGLAVPAIAGPLGWRAAFVAAACIAVGAFAAAPSAGVEAPRPALRAAGAGQRRRESRTTLALVVVAAAMASGIGVGTVSFLVMFATAAGVGQSAAGLLLGCVSLAAIAGRIVFGLRADRGAVDPLAVAIPLLLACTVGVTLLAFATPVMIVLGAMIMGFLGWTWHGVFTLAVVERNQDAPVWAVGMLMSGVFAGAVGGPLLVGTLAARTSFATAWTVCSALSVLPLIAIEAARRRGVESRSEPARIAIDGPLQVRVVGRAAAPTPAPQTSSVGPRGPSINARSELGPRTNRWGGLSGTPTGRGAGRAAARWRVVVTKDLASPPLEHSWDGRGRTPRPVARSGAEISVRLPVRPNTNSSLASP
jgi:MFS family permease